MNQIRKMGGLCWRFTVGDRMINKVVVENIERLKPFIHSMTKEDARPDY